jgi:hypothetical protein
MYPEDASDLGSRHLAQPSREPGALHVAEGPASRRTAFRFHNLSLQNRNPVRHRYAFYSGDTMPRATKPPQDMTAQERQQRKLAVAKKKRDSKARERKAKTEGVELHHDETVRAKAVGRAGIGVGEWSAFLGDLWRERRDDALRPEYRA